MSMSKYFERLNWPGVNGTDVVPNANVLEQSYAGWRDEGDAIAKALGRSGASCWHGAVNETNGLVWQQAKRV